MRSIFIIIALAVVSGCSATVQQSDLVPVAQAVAYTTEVPAPIAEPKEVTSPESILAEDDEVYQSPERVIYPGDVGTIVINTEEHRLYLVGEDGTAMKYTIAVGKDGGAEARRRLADVHIGRKAEWPSWTSTKPGSKTVPGGLKNPLGSRALYLFDEDGADTIFRIHGTNNPDSIGRAASSGCFRMRDNDVEDLYDRVPVGTKVEVI